MSANAGRVLILPKGAYSAGQTYNMLDLVKYNNKTFLAKRTNTNVTPVDGADWMELTDDGVQSFNSRVGAVVPTDGDYDISQISPLNGATVGMVPIVTNVGTAQEPVYEFDMGYVSGGGIGTSNSTDQLTDAYIATVSSGFIVTTGSYLSIIFGIAFTKPSSSALQLSIGGTAYEVKINGQSATVGKTYIKSGDAGIFVYDGTYFQLIGTSGGGHVIQNAAGTAVAQEPTMQFTDSHVTDDSTNEKTVVENIKPVTRAQFEVATEDGFYEITDEDDATMEEASADCVEVTADGVKTYENLLNELYALIDSTKLSLSSYIKIGNNSFRYSRVYNNGYSFVLCYGDTVNEAIDHFLVKSTNSLYTEWLNGTITQYQSNTPTSGTKITLYYGNDKAVVDLQTTANRCLLNSGETVESALTRGVRASGEYSFTASDTGISVSLSSIPNVPNGATIIGAILNQKTSAGTSGYALFNSSSSTISCINITSGKDYGLRVLYYI